MGIYDRDYYRKEGPSYLEALIPSGQVCKWLIVANIVFFIVQMLSARAADRPVVEVNGQFVHNPAEGRSPTFTEVLSLVPQKVLSGEVWRLLTYAFLHDTSTYLHLFFNMLFLWWFGSELERMYGPKEFLTFYLVAAVMGGLGEIGLYLATGNNVAVVGASGAVTALLVLFALHFPHQRILVFFLLPIPIWFFVIFQVAQDSFSLLSGSFKVNGVASVVHLAGAAFALLYYQQQWHILGLFQSLTSWKTPRSRPRLRLYRPAESQEGEPVPVSSAAPSSLDEHLEAKLDAVLEKVARHGQGSLTDAERQILLKASEIYKRRRT